jgi:hypothetical protein
MDIQNITIDIPQELQLEILKKITDLKTILNCRLVCKEWYNELNKVPLYKNYNLMGHFKFNYFLNTFTFENLENKILEKIRFSKFGGLKYYKYSDDGRIIKIVDNTKLFNCHINEYKHFTTIIKKDINLYNGEKKESITHLPAIPPCTIS